MTSDALLLLLLLLNDKPVATMVHIGSRSSSSTQNVLLLPAIDDGKVTVEVIMMTIEDAGQFFFYRPLSLISS